MSRIVNVVLCDVLGYSNDCFVLKEINILNNIMMSNSKYQDTLLEYEETDCILAADIKTSFTLNHNKNFWVNFYKMFLSEIAVLVSLKQYDEAISKYSMMFEVLKNYFGVDNTVSDISIKQKILAS